MIKFYVGEWGKLRWGGLAFKKKQWETGLSCLCVKMHKKKIQKKWASKMSDPWDIKPESFEGKANCFLIAENSLFIKEGLVAPV